MANTWSTTPSDWQGVDDEPTGEAELERLDTYPYRYFNNSWQPRNETSYTLYKTNGAKTIKITGTATSNHGLPTVLCFWTMLDELVPHTAAASDYVILTSQNMSNQGGGTWPYTFTVTFKIPADCKFIAFQALNTDIETYSFEALDYWDKNIEVISFIHGKYISDSGVLTNGSTSHITFIKPVKIKVNATMNVSSVCAWNTNDISLLSNDTFESALWTGLSPTITWTNTIFAPTENTEIMGILNLNMTGNIETWSINDYESTDNCYDILEANNYTLIGALNESMNRIIQANSKMSFVDIGLYSTDIRTLDRANNAIGKGHRLNKLLKYWAEKRGVEFIDMDVYNLKRVDETGTDNPMNTLDTWVADGVHPNSTPDWDTTDSTYGNTLVSKMAKRLFDKLSSIVSLQRPVRICWIGTSIPAGYGGGPSYPTIISTLANSAGYQWTITNVSVSGRSIRRYVFNQVTEVSNSFLDESKNNSIAQIVTDAANYDVIVFDHGINDFSADGTDININNYR